MAMFLLIDEYHREGWPTYDITDLLSEMSIVLFSAFNKRVKL
jgi:hypothetical protein